MGGLAESRWESWHQTAETALICLLLGLGLAMPLLALMGLSGTFWLALAASAGTALLCAGVSRLPRGGLILLGLSWLALIVWILLGGLFEIRQIWLALRLHFTSDAPALFLFARETAILLSVLLTLAAFALTRDPAGAFPVTMLTVAVAALLWAFGRERMVLWLLPAAAVSIAMLDMARRDGITFRRAIPLTGATVLIAWLLTAGGGAVIPSWKEAADSFRQRVYDYLFFTEPRNVFSLAPLGWYPQGQSQLGGPARPTDQEILQVLTPKTVYLRGSIRNTYTGRSWTDTTGGRRYLWISPRWQQERQQLFNQLLPPGSLAEGELSAEQTVRVRMLTGSASSLFVPQRVRTLSPGGSIVPYFNGASEVFATRDLEPGDTWSVTAPLYQAGDVGLQTLISACAGTEDPAYDAAVRQYTALPGHLQQLVYDLARENAVGDTPYEQALSLRSWLMRNCRYTLNAAEQPAEMDFVTNFLFNTREGYCTHFASALTVLCRMVGIPARYVEGFLAVPDESGRAVLTGRDGHAWTEICLKGFGWLTIDATPTQGHAGGNSGAMPPDQPDSTETEPDTPQQEPPENEPEEDPQQEPTPENDPDMPEPDASPVSLAWLWWLLLILAAAAAAALRILQTAPARAAAMKKDPTEAYLVWAQAIHDALYVRKLTRCRGESPMAFLRRADGTVSGRRPLLAPVGETLSVIHYGKAAPLPEETAYASHAWAELMKTMTPLQRCLTALRRAFIPLRFRDYRKDPAET